MAKKKIVMNGKIDLSSVSRGHQPHRSGAGIHRNEADKRSAAKLRRELSNVD